MGQTLKNIKLYFKERLLCPVWVIMPFFLFFIAHGPSSYQYTLIPVALIAIIFFRIFDDFFCFSYDLAIKKHQYLKNKSSVLAKPLFVSLILYLIALFFSYSNEIILLNLFCILLSYIFYIILKKNKIIIFISILKYPIILFSIASSTGEIKYFFVILVSLIFLGREILEECFYIRNKKIEIAFFLFLINIKIIEGQS